MKKLLLAAFTATLSFCARAQAHEHEMHYGPLINHLKYGNSSEDYEGLQPKGGMFLTLENGQIVFFNAKQFQKFRTMVENGRTSTTEILHSLNSDSSVKKISAQVTFNRDVVTVDDKKVTQKSLNRLRLSRGWSKVLQTEWPPGCSILNLGNARFLISGGNENEDNLYSTKAVVYNAETGITEKRFKMNYGRTCHSSVLLPDGKVFCVGGETSTGLNGTPTRSHYTNSAEILDIALGTSVTLKETLPVGVTYTTICTDAKGNPIIFGGETAVTSKSPLKCIIRYDYLKRGFNDVGALKVGRDFERPFTSNWPKLDKISFVIEECVEHLGDNKFIVDGGTTHRPSIMADFASGSTCTAEIVHLSKSGIHP